MGKGLVLVGIGTVIGLAMGFGVEQLMNSMLFNAGGVDIVAYIIVVPSLFLVTMLAAYVPARRASQIAPTQRLRYNKAMAPGGPHRSTFGVPLISDNQIPFHPLPKAPPPP